jgi:hypothetical protein
LSTLNNQSNTDSTEVRDAIVSIRTLTRTLWQPINPTLPQKWTLVLFLSDAELYYFNQFIKRNKQEGYYGKTDLLRKNTMKNYKAEIEKQTCRGAAGNELETHLSRWGDWD